MKKWRCLKRFLWIVNIQHRNSFVTQKAFAKVEICPNAHKCHMIGVRFSKAQLCYEWCQTHLSWASGAVLVRVALFHQSTFLPTWIIVPRNATLFLQHLVKPADIFKQVFLTSPLCPVNTLAPTSGRRRELGAVAVMIARQHFLFEDVHLFYTIKTQCSLFL